MVLGGGVFFAFSLGVLSLRFRRHSEREGPAVVRFSLDMDDLAEMEARYLRGEGGRLGRECLFYRWTQDAAKVYVTIPLPSLPPKTDVSLVISPEDFGMDCIFAAREIDGISGALAGLAAPELSSWDLRDDPIDGPSVEVEVVKAPREGYSEMWQAFLAGEVAAPTVQFTGRCEKTGARFRQRRDTVDVEFDLHPSVTPADIQVDVRPDSWAVDLGDRRVQGTLRGRVRPEDTLWLVDDDEHQGDHHHRESPRGRRTLYITLAKDSPTSWWSGLTERK
eukprot:CAMPEP_0118909366 /NCGR_PEP_ID=MMETSP1166-20130328/11974_1 /TAXON_ID=1104430 /ORGANISM="Chrysoreinhardia sp, Strain CCMP3193" /LENGTH=277 /DNA_ID=CAMNT_0006848789 /DNA_START=466 /DNA_END=1299 /DNA_ORIENTATION=-